MKPNPKDPKEIVDWTVDVILVSTAFILLFSVIILVYIYL